MDTNHNSKARRSIWTNKGDSHKETKLSLAFHSGVRSRTRLIVVNGVKDPRTSMRRGVLDDVGALIGASRALQSIPWAGVWEDLGNDNSHHPFACLALPHCLPAHPPADSCSQKADGGPIVAIWQLGGLTHTPRGGVSDYDSSLDNQPDLRRKSNGCC